jgi:hypothetical protein
VDNLAKKPKPTLKSLLDSQQLITGKKLIQQEKAKEDEAKRQKAAIDEAIEFERRNRRVKKR